MDFDPAVAASMSTQYETDMATIPCSIGWCCALFLTGLATGRAHDLLKTEASHVPGMPFARKLLMLVTVLNLVTGAFYASGVILWMGNNDRSVQGIGSYKVPDVATPFMCGLVGALAQSFMAARCYRILGKSKLFAAVCGIGVAFGVAGATWCTIASYHYMRDYSDEPNMFKATEIWLWSALSTDCIITACLAWHLFHLKQGFNRQTDGLLNALTRLAFETFFAPSFAVAATAIIYICTWRDPVLWNWCDLTWPAIPSLYTISFVCCVEGTARRRAETGRIYSDEESGSRKSHTRELSDALPQTLYCFPFRSKTQHGSVTIVAMPSEAKISNSQQVPCNVRASQARSSGPIRWSDLEARATQEELRRIAQRNLEDFKTELVGAPKHCKINFDAVRYMDDERVREDA